MRLARSLTAVLPAAALALLLAAPAAAAPLLEARVAADPASAKGRSYAVPHGGRVVLTAAVLFTEADVESVWVEPMATGGSLHAVAVALAREPSDRLRAFTGAAIGARVGILFEGRLTAAPVIRDAVDGRRLPVVFDLQRADADRAAAKLRAALPKRR